MEIFSLFLFDPLSILFIIIFIPSSVILCPPSLAFIKSSSFIFCLISTNGISSLSSNSFLFDLTVKSIESLLLFVLLLNSGQGVQESDTTKVYQDYLSWSQRNPPAYKKS